MYIVCTSWLVTCYKSDPLTYKETNVISYNFIPRQNGTYKNVAAFLSIITRCFHSLKTKGVHAIKKPTKMYETMKIDKMRPASNTMDDTLHIGLNYIYKKKKKQ